MSRSDGGCTPGDLIERLRHRRLCAVKMREDACAQRAKVQARHVPASNDARYMSPKLPREVGRGATALLAIGGSAGAVGTAVRIVASLPESASVAVAVALHGGAESYLVALMQQQSRLPVRWAASADGLRPGYVYVVPPGHHLVVNPDARLTVSTAPPRGPFRPSVDWLFESAAVSFGERHIAVVLSGRLHDGARGIRAVHRLGGVTFAEDPASCRFSDMPKAAIDSGCVDGVFAATQLPDVVARHVASYRTDADPSWQEPFAS